MKNTSYRFIGILFIATIFTSCGLDIFNGVVGNSNVVITERTIKADFSGIKVRVRKQQAQICAEGCEGGLIL